MDTSSLVQFCGHLFPTVLSSQPPVEALAFDLPFKLSRPYRGAYPFWAVLHMHDTHFDLVGSSTSTPQP
jgi:hypothetical protein